MQQEQRQRNVLFVPGAMTGKWIWEDSFAQLFESAGYVARTMQFKGHSASFQERLRMRFDDYVTECVNCINSFETPPLVVGHSLGGLVVLHAASRAPVECMALLSPAPVHGMGRSIAALARKSPISLAKFSAALVDARVTRYAAPPLGIYSESCDQARAESITRRLQSESLPVLLRLLSPPSLDFESLNPERILFLGATGDHIIPASEVVRSAKLLKSPYFIYDGLCHTFQAESSAPKIAEDIIAFFTGFERHNKDIAFRKAAC